VAEGPSASALSDGTLLPLGSQSRRGSNIVIGRKDAQDPTNNSRRFVRGREVVGDPAGPGPRYLAQTPAQASNRQVTSSRTPVEVTFNPSARREELQH